MTVQLSQHAHRARSRVLAALERWVHERPDETAVTAPDGAYTFAGLSARTGELAGALADAGAGPSAAAGLLLGRSRDSLPALLALWRLGAVAVPLDAGHPAGRIQHVLYDAGATVLLTDRLPEGLDTSGITVVDPAAKSAGPVAEVFPGPRDVAYVIYTSGTTGRPKGVEITYGNLDAFTGALGDLGLTPGGLGLNAVSPAFDGWLWCSLLHLVSGQGTALADLSLDGLKEAAAAGREPVPAGLRTVSLTPSLLAAHGDAIGDPEVIVVAGEPCPPALAERFAAGRRFLNVYGPTEATIAATWADSARGDDVTTIGRPLPGYRAYVLDEVLRPVAPGAEGELCVGGPGVARGYRNQQELTAGRFVPDPFVGGSARMYRTGDLVVRLPSGELAYRGRRDDQVKVRGHRVELGEVERIAAALPEVAAAACCPLPGGDALALGVVPVPGADPEALPALVGERCAELLPDAAVPRTVRILERLPVLPTGKTDRAELTRLLTEPDGGPGAAATGREGELLRLFGELLGREVTDPHADFFDLGGHSLLAARAVAEMRRRTGLRITLAQLLANPTAAGFAAELDRTAVAKGA